MLQIERVYKNVEKGEFAKAKDLVKAFGTDDQVRRTPRCSYQPCAFLPSPPLERISEHVRFCRAATPVAWLTTWSHANKRTPTPPFSFFVRLPWNRRLKGCRM